ncbi:SDR family oxidoreductase, partial [Chitinophaga sp. GbtcB8]|uniref:SDR family oxidoreductase n=1 Tax=Chitinophaga sp. GbtcB8 TaxID=2824753 RepID=UPI001C2F26AB
LSLDLLTRRIRVNTVTPGAIDTLVFVKMVPQDVVDQVKHIFIGLTPLGRQGTPAEIGKSAVFLASDDSSFIVGADILADGGMANVFSVK